MSASPLAARGRGNVVGVAEYRDWFDSDGRLVKEAQMRQRVFEGERTEDQPVVWLHIIHLGLDKGLI